MEKGMKTKYDLLREADKYEEDALCPEEVLAESAQNEKERYFEFYDDIKTSIKEDW